GDLRGGGEQRRRADHAGALQGTGDLAHAGAPAQHDDGLAALPRRRARAIEGPQSPGQHEAQDDRSRDRGARAHDGQPPDGGQPRLSPGGPAAAHETRRNTTEALVPPKPKLLDRATSIGIGLALRGIRSSVVSTEGLSRLMVGGAIWSRIASAVNAASIAPAAPSRWPVADLVELIAALAAAWPSSRSTAPSSISSPSGVEVPWA